MTSCLMAAVQTRFASRSRTSCFASDFSSHSERTLRFALAFAKQRRQGHRTACCPSEAASCRSCATNSYRFGSRGPREQEQYGRIRGESENPRFFQHGWILEQGNLWERYRRRGRKKQS